MKFLNITAFFGLSKRDKNAITITIVVSVNRNAWGTFVLGKDLTVAPGLVLVSNDIILQKPNLFLFVKNCLLAFGIFQVQVQIKVQNLVHALMRLSSKNVLCQPPQIDNHFKKV